jgi:transposase
MVVGKTNTALGATYRRYAARIGKAKAITAIARKLATLFYNALRYGMEYVDLGADYYEEQYQKKVFKNLKRTAESFGYTLLKNEQTISAA